MSALCGRPPHRDPRKGLEVSGRPATVGGRALSSTRPREWLAAPLGLGEERQPRLAYEEAGPRLAYEELGRLPAAADAAAAVFGVTAARLRSGAHIGSPAASGLHDRAGSSFAGGGCDG